MLELVLDDKTLDAMLRGKIYTVCGGLEPESLGITLPHEHIIVDFQKGLVDEKLSNKFLCDIPMLMENLGTIRRFPYSVKENLLMNKVEELIPEVRRFKQCGGATICDLSVVGIRCVPYKPESLQKISIQTGVNIVHATGFYCERFLPGWAKKLTIREMVDYMTSEIVSKPITGADQFPVPHGIVYIGCSSPLETNEKRALEAAAIVQKELGAPIIVHPGRSVESGNEILRIFNLHGVDLSRTCLSHIDRTFTNSTEDRKFLLQLARQGCYLNHSLFGKENSHYQYDSTFDMLSDAQRISQLKFLIEAGLEKQLLISHDVVCKHELTAYGGNGYSHLLEHVLPKMEVRGINRQTLDTILIDNTKNLLTFK